MTNHATRNSDNGRRSEQNTRSERWVLVDAARRENREREGRDQRELVLAARRAR